MTNTTVEPAVNKPHAAFRYFCDGCTGVAFLASNKAGRGKPGTCGSCGHSLGEIKAENFLPLEPSHPALIKFGGRFFN